MVGRYAPPQLTLAGNIGPAPLTEPQRVLAGSTHIVDATVVLAGRVDPELLAAAAHQVCRRHDALRTTVDLAESVQIVHDYSTDAVAVDHVPAEPGRLLETVDDVAHTELDPSRLPIFRCVVVSESPQRLAVYLAAPHTMSDLGSFQVIVRDFLEFLRSSMVSDSPRLPQVRAQFGDYLRWREQLLAAVPTWQEGGAGKRAMDFWAAKLAGAPSARFGFAGTVGQDGGMAFLRATIGASTTERMSLVCDRSGSSLFHAVLASFEESVARTTGTHDVLTMCLVHGRGRPQVRDTVGMFTEDVVFRHTVSAASRQGYLAELAKDVYLTYPHLDIPLAELARRSPEVERLYANRRFRGMFLQFRPLAIGVGLSPELPGVRVSFPRGVGSWSAYALPGIALFSVDNVGGGLEVELMYDSTCWPQQAMTRLFDGFLSCFDSFALRADEPLQVS